jgi:hypothetical protein
VLLSVDGSGHGLQAHAAARRATELFAETAGYTVDRIAEAIHYGLAPTRGAAIAVTDVDLTKGTVRFVGIGNIVGALVDQGKVRRMVSHNGTAGHLAPRLRPFEYTFSGPPAIVLHSDGLTSRWDLQDYPGLLAAHPSLIAGVLYRDCRRGRDDASIVAIRAAKS